MNVVFYCSTSDEVRGRILNAVFLAGPDLKLEILPSIDSLAARLREPMDSIGLVVIRATGREHLQQISNLRKSLRQVRVAIVLPDTHQDTVALAHTIHPSLMTYCESSLRELTAVIQKLIELENKLSGGCNEAPAGASLPHEGKASTERGNPNQETAAI